MSVRLISEITTAFERLSPARREQVVDYARWLRANPHASIPGRQNGAVRDQHLTAASGPPSCRAGGAGDPELVRAVHGLACEQQELIAEYVVALAENRGAPGHALRRFAGTIPEDVLDRMERIIEEEFERIDHDHEGW